VDRETLAKIANTIRHLSIDGVQKANSGHPGMPMGCAEIGAVLYGNVLRHNPKNPNWVNRDRFILSAGHGSMFLYSCLHLAGFDLPLDELKRFRQWHSKTPGHPEYGETPGVEATTGPLGQGIAQAVGQALGIKLLAAKFNTPEHTIFDAKVYSLAGDGCFMEGISSEASSFAGHLKLNNLVLIYDANDITLDGKLSDSCSEDVGMRYRAYGWDVFEVNGHDFEALDHVFNQLRQKQDKPALIIARTVIGKGAPNKAGTHKVHGSPLGEEEIKATRDALGLPQVDFYVAQAVRSYFEQKLIRDAEREEHWNKTFETWQKTNPEKAKEFHAMLNKTLPYDLEGQISRIDIKSPMEGRTASQTVINALADLLPSIYGGSADLSCSDMTMLKNHGVVSTQNFTGRNIKYGVREFGMAAIASGLAQTGMIIPYCGTFLTFSDYMRNAIRVAALMKVKVIYQFTHDSIFVGEDGPTHQPIEHYASLRAIPGLQVIRPADSNEVKQAWLAALNYQGPTAIILTRQKLPELLETKLPLAEGLGRGAYIVKREKKKADYTLLATGSELSLAMDVAKELEKHDKDVRVVSMPCWELFEKQSKEYRKSILCGDLGKRVSIEAGIELGWHKYIGCDGIAISMETFGASAPASVLAKEFGFTVEAILERIL
jgi:transketolase